jgi:glycogen debranching enzyme
MVSLEQAKLILDKVRVKLYTPKGLRSLSPDDPEYCSYYTGNQYYRDKAYHQGTVWSWLLGPYIDCLIRIEGNIAGKIEAKKVIEDFIPHLSEAGIGTVSEIFDAEPPFFPKGCIAQAWGVSEILRVYLGYKLYE